MNSSNTTLSSGPMPPTRGYQQEMFEKSLQRNTIVAMDTGSGKTLIAILRMKFECESGNGDKVPWFLAPTVALCEQQYNVIKVSIPATVCMISGAVQPDQWKNRQLWRTVLEKHQIIVSTPQPLLDALRHGYVNIGRDISLLVFDEAHHAVRNDPYNQIMKEFYFRVPVVEPSFRSPNDPVRPIILGLTASPIFGGNVRTAFDTIEANLDSTISAPRRNAEELASFVHRPIFKHVLFATPDEIDYNISTNVAALERVINQLDIEDDPYMQSLRANFQRLPPGSERTRVDQLLSKTISSGKTYTQAGLKDFLGAAQDICINIGYWAADWYVAKVLEHVKAASSALQPLSTELKNRERSYLFGILNQLVVSLVSDNCQDIVNGSTDKVRVLVECLVAEKASVEAQNETFSCLVFVTRRDAVLALAEVLSRHPQTKDLFVIGRLLGTSESRFRHTFLDITRSLFRQPQEETLNDLKSGDTNLVISTSVAEEGIDIQSCCNVIRWDPPQNMVSWAQSRGRARRQRSTFVVMFPDDGSREDDVKKWMELERQMVCMYNSAERELQLELARFSSDNNSGEDDDGDEDLKLHVESTGAYITPQSAVPHLAHFCAVIPSSSNVPYRPLYEIDPPDFPEGWHTDLTRLREPPPPYKGPFGSTVTLPRCIDPSLRVFSTKMVYATKASAHRHAAFKAYCALYEAGLLNDHLLPNVVEQEDDIKELLKDVKKRSGMADVSSQMNPWAIPEGSCNWWPSELAIDGLPILRMFTRSQPISLTGYSGPILYPPNRDPLKVEWRIGESSHVTSDVIEAARIYTRELFWVIYGNRMKWEDLDFSYLFLPTEDHERALWNERRTWLAEKNARIGLDTTTPFFANAGSFGNHFSYPNDLSLIRKSFPYGKPYEFVRWEFNPMSPEEEQTLLETYSRTPDVKVTYPLLVVHPFPRNVHFLVPTTSQSTSKAEVFLLPGFSSVSLFSKTDVEYAFLLPSIIRSLSMALTVRSLHETLLINSPLETVPADLLLNAILAPVACENVNYQRLETLGDTVLKFTITVQLVAEYRYWHEGYLAAKKDSCVSNARLAKDALSKELYRWIIRDKPVVRKWKPTYFSTIAMQDVKSDSEPSTSKEVKPSKKTKKLELSTKMLADVVEALIGAAYLHGSFELGIECAKLFGLGFHDWQQLPQRISTILSRVERTPQFPAQIENVESMIGYTFNRKLLLVEALTHSSYTGESRGTVSYERMEFLGDAVLDMIVTDVLYHAPGKKYSPGHMHQRRTAVVNAHFLAFICMQCSLDVKTAMPAKNQTGQFVCEDRSQKIYLWQCLLHSSRQVMDSQGRSFKLYQKMKPDIERALREDTIYPWAALTKLQAPKFISDIVESILGAVYLDSSGNLDVVRDVMRVLGILQILDRIVTENVDVLHPVSRLSMWAQKHGKEVEYHMEKDKGRLTCTIKVDDKEKVRLKGEYVGRASQEELRFLAAEQAIQDFKLRDDNSQTLGRKQKRTKKAKHKRNTTAAA